MTVVTSVDALAERIRARIAEQGVVIVGIAGFGGSGKSTLARALAERLPEARRVRGDDLLDPIASRERSDDWSALLRDELRGVLDELRAGRPAELAPSTGRRAAAAAARRARGTRAARRRRRPAAP